MAHSLLHMSLGQQLISRREHQTMPVLDGLVVKRPRRPLAALAIRLCQLMSGLVVMLGLVIATGHRVRRETHCIGYGMP